MASNGCSDGDIITPLQSFNPPGFSCTVKVLLALSIYILFIYSIIVYRITLCGTFMTAYLILRLTQLHPAGRQYRCAAERMDIDVSSLNKNITHPAFVDGTSFLL